MRTTSGWLRQCEAQKRDRDERQLEERMNLSEIDVYCPRCGRRSFMHVRSESTREHTTHAVCNDCTRSDQ